MVDMIDTWLLASACLALLMLGALFRTIRTKSRNDRYLAALVAITTGSAAGLAISISIGTLLVLDITIVAALICFAILAAAAQYSGRPSA
jgi:hypothetical protein